MPQWLVEILDRSAAFMPHGHCYLWIPSLLWMHVLSDALIGLAYLGISLLLYILVRRIRMPFSPVFIAFGLFIGLCGLTHFVSVWTVWNPDYFFDGLIKAATAAASVATAIGLLFVRPQIEAVVHTARLSEARRVQLESKNAELVALYQRVKDLDEVKTNFFANVSHELRTPLALIIGPVERMSTQDNLTAEQRTLLHSVKRNAQTLLQQVNDLLDISKLEAGRMQPHYARFDAAEWTTRIASQFQSLAHARELRYEVNVPAELEVEADPALLERVLLNLLANAFKFTPQSGHISVELSALTSEFALRVVDSGPGVPPSQRERIFERFRQADSGAAREHGGTGLGLAIAKEVVELHHGRIELDSTERGAAFTVCVPLRAPAEATLSELPATRAEAAAASVASTETQLGPIGPATAMQVNLGGQAATVLIAEDSAEMASFIALTLSEEYNVITAADGQQALEQAHALKPDLIITDLMMPRLSGDQLVERLRANADFDAVPIVLLTARTESELRVRMLNSGAQDFLSKPFVAQELLARVRNWIAVKRAGDALRSALGQVSTDVASLAQELAAKHKQLEIAFDSIEVAKQQAEEANKVKSYFLGLVSHELRTPLSNIFTNLRLFSRLAEHLPESAQLSLERLRRASQQMSTLIEGLLEYTRIESGSLRVDLAGVDPYAVAIEVVNAHRDYSRDDVKLSAEQPASDVPPMHTDPRLFRVVLDNLVSNALKFTRAGEVTVRICADDYAHIVEVHDTGIGIDQADLPRIFRPFELLEPVHRKSIPGVGLGLAIVERIVVALGGRIEVESHVGRGSIFRVRLPFAGSSSTQARQ